MAAQECLPTNTEKDKFAADYQVLNRAWNAVSPDPMLSPIQADYVWLTKVFESVKPTNGGGGLIWAALGPKTMEIVNSNMDVGKVHENEEILSLDAETERMQRRRSRLIWSPVSISIRMIRSSCAWATN